MTRIQKLFDDAVSSVPPSRLTADAVLGQARHRRRMKTAVAASVFAGAHRFDHHRYRDKPRSLR